MKKTFIVLLALWMTLLCACVERETVNLQNVCFAQPNYNNISSDFWNGNFWANDDTVFYTLYDTTEVYHNGTKTTLIRDNPVTEETYYGTFFVLGNAVYYQAELYEPYIQSIIYKYDLSTRESQKIGVIHAYIYEWMMAETYIAYTASNEDFENTYRLYVYDIASGSTSMICDSIKSYGIVNENLQYITHNGTFVINEYDPDSRASSIVGEFSCYSGREGLTFNFTYDKVTIEPVERNSYTDMSEFAVYSIEDHTLETYTLPGYCEQLIAAEQYAYAHCYMMDDDFTSLEKNGIYRINLSDGSRQKLEHQTTAYTELHVASDDEIFILQEDDIFCKTTVYRYRASANEIEQLFSYH